MSRSLLLTLTAAVLTAACFDTSGTPADISTRPDTIFLPGEAQPIADVARGVLYSLYPAGQGQVLAQTFTPPSNTHLGWIALPVTCAVDTRLIVRIRDGLAGEVMRETQVAGLTGSAGPAFVVIRLWDPAAPPPAGIALQGGRTYAIELAASTTVYGTRGWCGIAAGPLGDSYPRGQGFYQDPVIGPDFLPLPSGHTGDQEDLPFMTEVQPAPYAIGAGALTGS